MFKVEIKNLSINANIGITAKERAKKQVLKVNLEFKKDSNKGAQNINFFHSPF